MGYELELPFFNGSKYDHGLAFAFALFFSCPVQDSSIGDIVTHSVSQSVIKSSFDL